MNLLKIFRTVVAISLATLGLVSQSQAAVTAFFSTTPDCVGASSAFFSPGGPTVQVSLCMTTTPSTATCGHTIVLQAAMPAESNKFVITSSTLGAGYPDPNSEVAQLPLAITNPPIIADLGGTGSAPVQATANQLLATFSLAPQSGATNASYVISLNNVSIAAVDADGTCGATTVPSDAAITASFTLNRSSAPFFTSASSTTFSTASANTFAVTATGIPTPTINAGTLPAGVSFVSGGANTGTGTLSTANGTFTAGTITFTATSGALTQPQTFILTSAAQATQTINFANPGTQTFTSTPLPLVATATPSNLPVTFSTGSPAVCLVSGSNVTMVALGQCTINANSAGNATYLAAPTVQQVFGIIGTVPGAPIIGAGTPGNGQATVAFTAPTSTGGLPIGSYTLSCGSASITGSGSPLTVTNLTNGTPYNCSVTATNAQGTGSASGVVVVTPSVGALSLIGVVSRKTHGMSGDFDLPIDPLPLIGGSVSVEPRARIVAGVASHTIIFQFSGPITSVGVATTTAGTAAAATFLNNEVTVVLSGIADRQRVTVSVPGVNATLPVSASIGFLVGDVNGTRDVDTLDISPIRAKSGLTSVTTTTFKLDLNADGAVDTLDISAVRARAGAGI